MKQIVKQALAMDDGTSKITLVQFDLSSMEVVQTATEPDDSDALLSDGHKHGR